MIFTKTDGNIKEREDLGHVHIETAMVKSDDLAKSILRVKSDHHNEYGIRLEEGKLENGSFFFIDDHNVLVLNVIPEKMIVITPKDMDDCGIIAHMLGNMHKPVKVKDGKISLLYDSVVAKNLEKSDIDFKVEEIQLEESLRYVDLS